MSSTKDPKALDATIRDEGQLDMSEDCRLFGGNGQIDPLVDVLGVGLAKLVPFDEFYPTRMIRTNVVVVVVVIILPSLSDESVNPNHSRKVPPKIFGIDDDPVHGACQAQTDDGPVNMAGSARPRRLPTVSHVFTPPWQQ